MCSVCIFHSQQEIKNNEDEDSEPDSVNYIEHLATKPTDLKNVCCDY